MNKSIYTILLSVLLILTMSFSVFSESKVDTQESEMPTSDANQENEDSFSDSAYSKDDAIKKVERISLSKQDLLALTDLLSVHLATEEDFANYSVDNITVGSEIPNYEYMEGSLKQSTIAKYYPVYCQEQIIGIFTINNPSSPTYMFGRDWANKLNDYLGSGEDGFCVVANANQMFFKSSTNATLFMEYELMEDNTTKSSLKSESITEKEVAEAEGEQALQFFRSC